MITTLVFVSCFCIVAVLVYMARYSGRVRFTHTRLIDAPMEKVFPMVADFQNWNDWNPWLAHESSAELKITGDNGAPGSHCAWESNKFGTGEISLVRSVACQSLEQRVRLKHPFLVRGRSYWKFVERDGKTEVNWQVKARVAFTMRAFAQTVKAALELDCKYGLDRLAGLVEPADAPRYSVVTVGAMDVPACRYVYQTYQGSIKGLPDAMLQYVSDLRKQLGQLGITPIGVPLAFYTKTNIKLRTTVCHIGLPIGDADVGQMAVREMPAHRAYRVRLLGGYDGLEFAWYHAMQCMSLDNFKPDQRLPPFESYLVGPDTASSNAFVTEVNIPILVSPL